MANITAAREMPLEGMPDAPDEEWVKAWLQQQNGFGRQVGAAFQRAITIGENTTSLVKSIDLVHGQSVTVANPLSVPIQGIFAIGCIGLSVGSDGRPNGGIYDLAIPDLQAKPSTRGDGSWVVQANYEISPSESTFQTNETIIIQRLRSAATSLSSGTTVNVGTTASVSLTPGFWSVRAQVGFTAGATATITNFIGGVSATSATLSPADTLAVPTNGECRQIASLAGAIINNDFTLAIPDYSVTVATGSTLPLFLISRAAFGGVGGTVTTYGSLEARRSVPYLTGRTGRVKLFFFGG